MAVCVDRIVTSPAACLQEPSSSSADEKKEESVEVSFVGENGSDATKDGIFNGKSGGGISFSSKKLKGSVSECRICQEEDEDEDLESPCACSGTLKVLFFLLFIHSSSFLLIITFLTC